MAKIQVLDNTLKLLEQHNIEKIAFKAISEILPISFYWMNADGILLGCNEKVLHDLHINKLEDFIGKHSRDIVTEQAWKNSQTVMMTGIASIVEEEHYEKETNSTTNYLSIKSPVFEKKKVIGLVGISVDITDQKHAEQLKKEKETAEKVTKFSNLVAGSVAHEVCTPLGGISSQIDLLNMIIPSINMPTDKEKICKDVIKEIRQIINSSVHVIRDMLLKVRSFATGQVHHGDFVLTSITTDVEESLTSYPFAEEEKELIKLKGFDNFTNRFKYLGDAFLTQHVLSNLLRNALYAIRIEGKGDITIEIKTGSKFNELIFRDTASGIPADFVAKIFDQYETKKDTHGGTGLGLAFCKMVMQSYGGDITCNSKEGAFSEFVLSFPKI